MGLCEPSCLSWTLTHVTWPLCHCQLVTTLQEESQEESRKLAAFVPQGLHGPAYTSAQWAVLGARTTQASGVSHAPCRAPAEVALAEPHDWLWV